MSDDIHASDLAHRYVAGLLDEPALDAFEQHLLVCEDCRETVRVGAAARAGLRAWTPTRWRAYNLRAAAVAAAAVLVVAVALLPRGEEDALARVSAPPFVAAAVRETADSTAQLVDRGMSAYAARNYAGAAALLERAAATDSSPGVALYLGAALLLRGNVEQALPPLLRARQPAGNPFASDATLLAAKALLRMDRPDSALVLLDTAATVADDASDAGRLRAFADSIRRR